MSSQSLIKFASLLTHYFIHTWETKCCQHCGEWVHLCYTLKADWIFSITTWVWTPNSFPCQRHGLAILSLACPDLAPDQSLNSNTYKSQRYTSRQNNIGTVLQLGKHMFTFFLHFILNMNTKRQLKVIRSYYFQHWRVEETCCARILLLGTEGFVKFFSDKINFCWNPPKIFKNVFSKLSLGLLAHSRKQFNVRKFGQNKCNLR
jgi:hypothetical protein